MSDYRSEAREVISDARWTGWKVLVSFLGFFIVVGVIGFTTRAVGLWGQTVVERKVFENSYQYTEARKSEIAKYEAALISIDAQLQMTNLDESTRQLLEARKIAVTAKLNAVKAMK